MSDKPAIRSTIIGNTIDSISVVGNMTAGVFMMIVSLIICYEAISRHIFASPTTWVMSVSLFAFMWFPFLSSPYGIKEGKHVACDVFVSALHKRTRQWLGIFTDLTTLIFIISLGYFGYEHFIEAYEFKSMSVGLTRYPLWILRIIFPVSMLFCLLQTLRKISLRIAYLKTDNKKAGTGWHNNPKVLIVSYIITIAIGLFVFSVNQPLGILVMVLILIFWGVPVAFALGSVGVIGLIFFHGSVLGLNTVPIIAENTVHNFVLLAIPLFTLGGVILSRSGLGEQIYDLSSKWLGWLPGGLGVATCITGGILAAMIGGSTPVTVIITLVAIAPLLRRGYNKKLVIGTVTGTSLGLIIPPSIGFIVYGYLTETSVGELFMAGFIPGIMLVVMFSIYIIIVCKITGEYEKVSYTLKERLSSLGNSFLIVLGPIFVLGSIYTGFATPTEAGAILVIYSLFCTLVYRKMDWKMLIESLMQSSMISTMILMIMVGALTMANVITLLQIPTKLVEFVIASGLHNIILISILVVFYLFLGMFLDGASITVLTVPVLAPMLPVLGINTVVFGVILMMLIETALLTPPVGLNIFAVKGIVDEPLGFIIKSVFPFVLILVFATILIFLFPNLALWLPTHMK